MQTLNETSTGLNYVDVAGDQLLELLQGVSTHASKDKALPTLNAVQLESTGGAFIARATDRYRLIEGTMGTLEGGQLDPALVSLEDIKRIITLLKDHKGHLIGFSRIGDTLSVSALGDSISCTVLEGKYPPTAQLFTDSEGDPIAIEGVAFNPALMADYAKIAGKGAGIKLYFNGESKPIRVRITGDKVTWRALLMPMRYKD